MQRPLAAEYKGCAARSKVDAGRTPFLVCRTRPRLASHEILTPRLEGQRRFDSLSCPGCRRRPVAADADLGAAQLSCIPASGSSCAPTDWYAFGAHRGGIDERWFASTTEAANENRTPDEGLSYVAFEGQRFTLRDAVAEAGPRLIGKTMFDKYKRWPVYSKFFDNMGPIPHHMHQTFADATLVGQEGKPESYYFPPQYNNVDNNFAYTFMGLEPGTTKAQVRKCLEDWDKGDNGILDLVAGLSAEARHRLADSARRAARPRLALHLRAAMGLRRVRHVPVAGRRARSALVAVGQGHAQGEAPRSRLHRRAARLGKERRYAFQGAQLPGADRRPARSRQRATPIAGSSTARSTASSCSAPRN